MRITGLISALVLLGPSGDACLRVSPVDPGIPAVPCKTCEHELIDVLKAGDGDDDTIQNMFADDIITTGNCAVRTFTCKGKTALIVLTDFTDIEVGSEDDIETPGTATISVTCNAEGTGWLAPDGGEVKTAECSFVPPCLNCDTIPIAETGFDTPGEINFGDCVTKTFTCTSAGAMIEVASTGGGVVKTVTDEGTGTVTYTVTCNGDTQWEDGGNIIAAVKCTKGPAVDTCKTCTKDTGGLIVYKEGETSTSQNMTDDMIVTTGSCAERTFTCTGDYPLIEYYVNEKPDYFGSAPSDGISSIFTVTCNADGTGWVFGGYQISYVECYFKPQCLQCPKEDITNVNVPVDITVSDTNCNVRTLSCNSDTVQLVVTTDTAMVKTLAGTVSYAVTCNKDGTGWEDDGGDAITKAECVPLGNTCKDCTMESLNTTPATPGAKEFFSDVPDDTGACVTRTLTCVGNGAGIDVYNGGQYLSTVGISYTLTCNADGETWSIPGIIPTITTAQCTALQ